MSLNLSWVLHGCTPAPMSHCEQRLSLYNSSGKRKLHACKVLSLFLHAARWWELEQGEGDVRWLRLSCSCLLKFVICRLHFAKWGSWKKRWWFSTPTQLRYHPLTSLTAPSSIVMGCEYEGQGRFCMCATVRAVLSLGLETQKPSSSVYKWQQWAASASTGGDKMAFCHVTAEKKHCIYPILLLLLFWQIQCGINCHFSLCKPIMFHCYGCTLSDYFLLNSSSNVWWRALHPSWSYSLTKLAWFVHRGRRLYMENPCGRWSKNISWYTAVSIAKTNLVFS